MINNKRKYNIIIIIIIIIIAIVIIIIIVSNMLLTVFSLVYSIRSFRNALENRRVYVCSVYIHVIQHASVLL